MDCQRELRLPRAIFHTWECNLQQLRRLPFSILFAGFTGLCAQLRFYLPFTPVPVTGQVFAVLLSAVILGKEYGSLSQLFYLIFGIMGIPWFVIGFIGPSGGYIVGFIVAPYIIGFLLEKVPRLTMSRKGVIRATRTAESHPFSRWISSLMVITLIMLAGVIFIYLFGLIQFSIYTGLNLESAIRFAVLPFIPFDFGKAFLAAVIARSFMK